MAELKREVKKVTQERMVPVVEVVPDAPVPAPITPAEPKKVTSTAQVRIPDAQPPQAQWGMFFAGMATMLLLIIIAGGLWWKLGMPAGPLMQATPEPKIVEATPTPMPTSEPIALKTSDFELTVLNGSGETGLAGTTATKLKALGYEVGQTGNASLQKGTTIAFGEQAATLSAEIIKDLQPVLGEVTVETETLDEPRAIQVILGQED